MKSRRRYLLPLAAIGVSFAGSGVAAPADIAEQWGLLGSWAVDCRQPPTNDNAYYSFVREGAALVIRRDIGSLKDDNTVISASVTASGEIELVTEYKAFSHVMTSRYARDGADRFRAQSNKDEKNVYAIRDGKSTRTGSAVPAMSRCLKAD